MTDQKKVIVKINGQSFTVVGNESEKYIKHIAEYVDEKVSELTQKNKKLSQSMAAILAAFNIADEYYKNCVELNELKENVVKPLKELEELKLEADSNAEKITTLKRENDSYKDELLQSKREIERLSKRNRQSEQALKLKEDELNNSQKIINDLQHKLFENQIELVQAKKELEEMVKTLDNKPNIEKKGFKKF